MSSPEKPGVLDEPRGLVELSDDSTGQLTTEWVLVTTFVVMPMILLIPVLIGMIRLYFHRIAEVVHLPFP